MIIIILSEGNYIFLLALMASLFCDKIQVRDWHTHIHTYTLYRCWLYDGDEWRSLIDVA